MKIDFAPLHKFLASTLRRDWVKFFHAEVYMRRATRYSKEHDCLVNTLDVATVNVKPRHQGKGWFSNYLTMLEAQQEANKACLYVENAHRRLSAFLERRGYILDEKNNMGPDLSCWFSPYVKEIEMIRWVEPKPLKLLPAQAPLRSFGQLHVVRTQD